MNHVIYFLNFLTGVIGLCIGLVVWFDFSPMSVLYIIIGASIAYLVFLAFLYRN